MGRKIRFPIKMKNGAEVRTLDELKENFDLESVLGYFTDGRLATWLSDRYYDEKAEAVAALSADMPDLNAKLCEILEVEYQAENDEADVNLIAKRREKIQIISGVTDNKEILDNIDLVAMDQDELFDILDESPEKVYLYGDKFEIPFGKKNISYIGIDAPLVVLEKEKGIYLYKKNDIKFSNVKFEDTINPDFAAGERLFLKGRFQEAFPLIKEAAENGNPRAMYIMARYCNDGYETVTINNKERNNWCEKAYSYKEPLSMYGYAAWCLKDKQDEQNKLYSQIFNDIKFLAESDDALAQGIIGWMYDTGHGVEKDKTKAVEWYRKATEQGYAYAQCNLGTMYSNGYGIEQDKTKAVEWYRKAAEQGYVRAQCNLGYMYENGTGVDKDFGLAEHWYIKAANQDYIYAIRVLEKMYEYIEKAPYRLVDFEKGSEPEIRRTLGKYNGVLGNMTDPSFFSTIYTRIKEEILKWYIRGAELMDPECLLKAGHYICFMYPGSYSKEETFNGIKWLKAAANYNQFDAYYFLGYIYLHGIHENHNITSAPFIIEPDKNLAIDYFTKGANAGNSYCRNQINKMNQPEIKHPVKKSFLSGLFG
ncbi:MAG TPA: hypothetical protein P5092_08265 [Ruminococcus sp.]|nr:hypothetical protein [Ruminococcus sp.]